MSTTIAKQPLNVPSDSAAARLLAGLNEILESWAARVKTNIQPAEAEAHPIIINTIPAFLENLAEALAPNFPREIATEGTTIAEEHGGERARVTRFSPQDVIREYQLLRDTLIEFLSKDRPLSPLESNTIIKSIDQAVGQSLNSYFLVFEGFREQFGLALSHDLRNPLSAIKASTDLILRYPDRVELPILVARIAENANRIDRMTQDLLDASRVRFGERLTLEVAECEIYQLVQDTLADLATLHGNRFQLKGTPIQGFWNRDALRRAVENLVVNAIKYGSSTTPITVVVKNAHGRTMVSVHNEGSYIPREEQETIFLSFMRAKSAQNRKKAGWGLGLALVRGVAEGHGGSITIDSTPERGTTFLIDLPTDSRPHLSNPVTPGSV
jgi:signal transduction histidine kinase